ncbi:E3 SUMO-protein ligase ZBED1-like [Vanacampus margaritifer]
MRNHFISAHFVIHRLDDTDGFINMEQWNEAAARGVLGGKFFFQMQPDGSFNKSVVFCLFCQKQFAYHRNNSTLRYHLNAKHPFANDADDASRPATSRQQRRIGDIIGFRTSESTSEKLTTSIVNWIALDCRPLSIVEDKGLEKVLQIATCNPTLKLPCRDAISDILQQMYDTEKLLKFDALKNAQFVALTGDYWSSVRDEIYVGVTAHIVDVTNGTWHLQSFIATVLNTDSRHVENCHEEFLSVAEAWGIRQKITTIGTESAPNTVAAEKRLQFQHVPCIAHILQSTIAVSLFEGGFNGALIKCRKIVAHFKHSPENTEELYQEQSRLGQENEPLVQDVSTRWNSTLDMVARLLKNQEAVFTALDKQKHALNMLTPSEILQLQKMAIVLEPCRFVSELLGGETFVPCSVVLPALCHLQHAMEVSDDDPDCIAKFKTAFAKDLSRRAATLNHEWLKMAAVLDPRFKDLKCLKRGEREEVWTRLEVLLQEQFDGTAAPEPRKKKRLLSSFDSESDSDEEAQWIGALKLYRSEISISETDCPLHWWAGRAATHPELSVLARKYLSSPATSVPCERLFSLAGHVVTKKRAVLSAANVNRLVCLSNWLKDKENK